MEFGPQVPDLDVLIVGAGLSGLTSGIKILSKEHALNLRIIEESSVPGGQIAMQGVRFVNNEQKELITFMDQLKVPLEQRQLYPDVSLKRCWDIDRGLIGALAKFELYRYIEMLEMRVNKFSSTKFRSFKRVQNMERHICSNLFFSISRQFMYNIVELIGGRAASNINYDEFMCICNSCGGLKTLIDIFFVVPPYLLDLPCERVMDVLLKRLAYTEIHYNVRATRVQHFKNYVSVRDSMGTEHVAQAVILAIPWNKVLQLEFDPPLPKQFVTKNRQKVKSSRQITQFMVFYNKSYWYYQGFSGHFMNSLPLVIGFELRPTIYCGYMLHTPDELSKVRDTVLELLAEKFGKEMLTPKHYEQKTYDLNEPMDRPLIKPWHRVIWSSSSAVIYNRNLMGGAVESGIRAAINALFVVRPQVVGWRDLLDVQEKNILTGDESGYTAALLGRLNIYNVTFYSIFIVGIIYFLNLGYSRTN
ncbi:CG13611 [Drosophila busckii]|uniref:monoamine oxidase n=1 Tax=Drosophila busckii TaxID=30019 RepID=A0A0M5J797_DROBS|nr:amine oxidase [flavin-containing] B [Drosophila busckii]ALC47006.1 CG13611 [Drosophila busckii]